jgi:hypothetical protein
MNIIGDDQIVILMDKELDNIQYLEIGTTMITNFEDITGKRLEALENKRMKKIKYYKAL